MAHHRALTWETTMSTSGPVHLGILVGVDGSEHSDLAVDWAAQEASTTRRPLTLAHGCGEVSSAPTPALLPDEHGVRAGLLEHGRTVTAAARARALAVDPHLEVSEVVETTEARALLLERSVHAEMLVVGSRGRGLLERLLLGSVSTAVARHCEVPLVVVRPPGAAHAGVLVADDATPASRTVLEFAYQQADQRHLPLTVLHCSTAVWGLPPGPGEDPGSVRAALWNDERIDLAESIAGLAEKYPDVVVRSQVGRGFPEAVVPLASSTMDLVVVGSRHRTALQRLLAGAVSTVVVEHASCPVAVVPVGPGA